MLPPLLLAMCAMFPLLLLSPASGAVVGSPLFSQRVSRVFWLSGLLILCMVPFIFEGAVEAPERLLPSCIAIIVLYLLYLLEQENSQGAADARQNMHDAFVDMTTRIDGKDSELCSNLHDELNPCLIFAKRTIEECQVMAAGQEQMTVILHRAVQEIDRAYAISRCIISKVHVEALTSIGLVAALEDLISHYNEISPLRPKLQHNLDGKTEKNMDRARTICIYRIIREAMLNAVKHSRARSLLVSLDLQQRGQALCVRIRDDGVGIPTHHVPGTGLIDMRMRALQAGGMLSISNGEDNCGTLIELQIPVK